MSGKKYGYLYKFTHDDNIIYPHEFNRLKIEKVRERKSHVLNGLAYINNTNLTMMPSKCLGVLVAYSNSYMQSDTERQWYLGVILHMSIDNISVIPCGIVDKSKPIGTPERFGLDTYHQGCLNMVYSNRLKIQYLNCIHEKISLGSDNYIESLFDGPDIIFHHSSFPNMHLKNIYNKVCTLCLILPLQ